MKLFLFSKAIATYIFEQIKKPFVIKVILKIYETYETLLYQISFSPFLFHLTMQILFLFILYNRHFRRLGSFRIPISSVGACISSTFRDL